MQNNIIQMLQRFSQMQNPINMMMQMYGSTPQFQQIMQIIQNKTPQEIEQYVRNVCKTQNIDIDNLISMAKQFGIR